MAKFIYDRGGIRIPNLNSDKDGLSQNYFPFQIRIIGKQCIHPVPVIIFRIFPVL